LPAAPLSTAILSALSEAARAGQTDRALEALRSLAQLGPDDVDESPFRAAADLLNAAGWWPQTQPVIAALVREQEVHPATGRIWSRAQLAARNWDAYKDLRPLLDAGPLGEQAVVEWVEQLTALGERYQLQRAACVGEYWLSANPIAWGAIAGGFRRLRLYREGHYWVVAWREREVAHSSDLLSVAEILRSNHDVAGGAAANQAALQRFPQRDERHQHECWLAADDVLADDIEAADRRLSRVDVSRFDAADRLLQTLVTAAVSVGRVDPPRMPEAVADAVRLIDDSRSAYRDLPRDPARLALFRRLLHLLSECGGFTTRLWCWWRERFV